MLTVATAAARAGVSEGLVRKWVADGTLPHYRLGAKGRRGKIAIASDDLDRVLASFRVEVLPPAKLASTRYPKTPFKHVRA